MAIAVPSTLEVVVVAVVVVVVVVVQWEMGADVFFCWRPGGGQHSAEPVAGRVSRGGRGAHPGPRLLRLPAHLQSHLPGDGGTLPRPATSVVLYRTAVSLDQNLIR